MDRSATARQSAEKMAAAHLVVATMSPPAPSHLAKMDVTQDVKLV